MTTAIVPWKCHVCYGSFDTLGGGICARCNQATCRSHISRFGENNKSAEWLCSYCLTMEEKVTMRKGKKFWKLLTFGLRGTREPKPEDALIQSREINKLGGPA